MACATGTDRAFGRATMVVKMMKRYDVYLWIEAICSGTRTLATRSRQSANVTIVRHARHDGVE